MTYVLRYYSSADGPESAKWSVYRERYLSPKSEVPIDGSQEHVSTHPTEAEADTEANRLQRLATPVDNCRHCGRRLIWDFVDYSDTPGWIHEDGEALCTDASDSPQAEPKEAP